MKKQALNLIALCIGILLPSTNAIARECGRRCEPKQIRQSTFLWSLTTRAYTSSAQILIGNLRLPISKPLRLIPAMSLSNSRTTP